MALCVVVGTTSKSLRTRARLMEAAVEAFAECGYDITTIDDLATRAGVAHGTVYRYFANKEAVLLAVVAEKLTNLAAEMHDALANPKGDDQVWAIRRFLEHASANRRLTGIWIEVAATRNEAAELRKRLRAPFIEAIATQVRKAQVNGHLDRGVDPEVAARALGAMVDNFAYVWFVIEDRPADEAELDRLARTLATLWGGALGTTRTAVPELFGPAAVHRVI